MRTLTWSAVPGTITKKLHVQPDRTYITRPNEYRWPVGLVSDSVKWEIN